MIHPNRVGPERVNPLQAKGLQLSAGFGVGPTGILVGVFRAQSKPGSSFIRAGLKGFLHSGLYWDWQDLSRNPDTNSGFYFTVGAVVTRKRYA